MSTQSNRPDTIVLIHGFWVTPRSWEHWIMRYISCPPSGGGRRSPTLHWRGPRNTVCTSPRLLRPLHRVRRLRRGKLSRMERIAR
jgi:hypothetical protein